MRLGVVAFCVLAELSASGCYLRISEGDEDHSDEEAGEADAGIRPGSEDAGGEAAIDAAVVAADPCPNLPIPGTCFGRGVMYREWSSSAVGDGTYFASQAPYRLGFNRVRDRIWIVKFRTESDNYRARISAGADSVSGMMWISDQPCDANFAEAEHIMGWGPHGSVTLDFLVARNAADAQALAAVYSEPQLEGDHCYYAAFENTGIPSSFDAAYIETAPDPCGTEQDPSCYYLGIDMEHRLHATTGQTIASHVLPGFTIGP